MKQKFKIIGKLYFFRSSGNISTKLELINKINKSWPNLTLRRDSTLRYTEIAGGSDGSVRSRPGQGWNVIFVQPSSTFTVKTSLADYNNIVKLKPLNKCTCKRKKDTDIRFFASGGWKSSSVHQFARILIFDLKIGEKYRFLSKSRFFNISPYESSNES